MSFPALTAAPVPASTLRSGVDVARELSALVDEIQRTRDWFNTQVEAQLSSLRRLGATMQHMPVEETHHACLSTLFEAPHPVVDVETPAAIPESAPSPTPLAVALANAFAPATHGFMSAPHQAVVLPPTHVATLDPELEQATLRELNDALAKAFSEISSRGGMLG